MFETVGQITVGCMALACILIVLQVVYEIALGFIGYRRYWIVRFRSQHQLTQPFPFWTAAWHAVTLRLLPSGDFMVGGLRVPANPRRPIRREHFWGA